LIAPALGVGLLRAKRQAADARHEQFSQTVKPLLTAGAEARRPASPAGRPQPAQSQRGGGLSAGVVSRNDARFPLSLTKVALFPLMVTEPCWNGLPHPAGGLLLPSDNMGVATQLCPANFAQRTPQWV